MVDPQLSPRQGVYEHAVVILEQWLQQPSGATEQLLSVKFDADLLRSAHGWRVANFAAQP
jgi:hypothetical protein